MIAPAIHFEVWLPLADWNGKFQGTGNGGYNGSIMYEVLSEGVRRHYATASTDMGHEATSPDPGSWALGHPELVVDQGYRAQHETALKSKAIIRAFYHAAPRHSYFTGCSSGGWQGLTEAQRFPHDYDGIVAGAPAIDVVHFHAAILWKYQAAQKIAPSKYRLVSNAVLAKCDANDGVKDGVLENPLACSFSPQELACKSGSSSDRCLTPDEVSAFQRIYDGARYSSGSPIYPGWPLGSEYDLPIWIEAHGELLAASTFKDMAFEDPNWDFNRIDFDRDVRKADAKIGAVMNSSSPNLREFRRTGGKLILYHGWNDGGISALNTLQYFERVAAFMSGAKSNRNATLASVQDFARLFMVPGVGHCGGGPGPDRFDMLSALEDWVEQGVAPDRVNAAHFTNDTIDRTRPLCPYPQTAHYQGGDSNRAEQFECR